MPRSLTTVPKFDHYCSQLRIKTSSNYIDRVSQDRFHRDLGRLSLFFRKRIDCRKIKKNKIVKIKLKI